MVSYSSEQRKLVNDPNLCKVLLTEALSDGLDGGKCQEGHLGKQMLTFFYRI
jgi:hypothetical protein